MRKYCFVFCILISGISKLLAQDSIPAPKAFFNWGVWHKLSTNGKSTASATNNVALALLCHTSENVYGFSLAPFNIVNSSIKGVQIGVLSSTETMSGLQIGFFNTIRSSMNGMQIGFFNWDENGMRGIQTGVLNTAKQADGVQIGFMNGAEKISGVQIGFGNERGLQSDGVQIGFFNSAEHNDYPIGLINIIKDGEMGVAITLDEMSNTVASFRSGGKYLYGIVGLGYNFDSPHHHMLVEAGLGLNIPVFKNFGLKAEVVYDILSKPHIKVQRGAPEDYEGDDDYDYKLAFHSSIRLMSSYKISKKINFFGGPSINYLRTGTVDNLDLFPKYRIWQKFEPSSFKQIYWGWTFGVQYKLR